MGDQLVRSIAQIAPGAQSEEACKRAASLRILALTDVYGLSTLPQKGDRSVIIILFGINVLNFFASPSSEFLFWWASAEPAAQVAIDARSCYSASARQPLRNPSNHIQDTARTLRLA